MAGLLERDTGVFDDAVHRRLEFVQPRLKLRDEGGFGVEGGPKTLHLVLQRSNLVDVVLL